GVHVFGGALVGEFGQDSSPEGNRAAAQVVDGEQYSAFEAIEEPAVAAAPPQQSHPLEDGLRIGSLECPGREPFPFVGRKPYVKACQGFVAKASVGQIASGGGRLGTFDQEAAEEVARPLQGGVEGTFVGGG